MDIFRIAVIGVVGAILALILKEYKKEYAIICGIAVSIIIFFSIISQLNYVFEFMETIYNKVSYGKVYLPVILKILAIAYISDFASQICRDMNEGAIGMKIELAGKLIIFYLALPVMVSIMDLVERVLPA